MTFHAFIEYLKYRLHAQTRHGVHSPFVYRFVESGLRGKNGLTKILADYFGEDQVVSATDASPAHWQNWLAGQLPALTDKNVIVIPGIHKTKSHTACWNELCNSNHIILSIDLYTCGLLFINRDIKQKQHFVIKYPL